MWLLQQFNHQSMMKGFILLHFSLFIVWQRHYCRLPCTFICHFLSSTTDIWYHCGTYYHSLDSIYSLIVANRQEHIINHFFSFNSTTTLLSIAVNIEYYPFVFCNSTTTLLLIALYIQYVRTIEIIIFFLSFNLFIHQRCTIRR